MKYLLGYDIGTSSVKASVVDIQTGECLASAFYPESEAPIIAHQTGWAEQEPEMWWQNLTVATKNVLSQASVDGHDIEAIGISYQMHGLVCVDKDGQVLRPSIIWCDGRAVPYGQKAFDEIGHEQCLTHLLNSPGNFTAAKLAWVKENEPELYARIHKIMLPGDYIAMRLSGGVMNTTVSGLSEGMFWDFKEGCVSKDILRQFGFSESIIPDIVPTFAIQSRVCAEVAEKLGLTEGTPIAYRGGDQPNNALSLGVMRPGEIAATGGTSGVVYGVLDKVNYDPQSRVNTFAHVNHMMDNGKRTTDNGQQTTDNGQRTTDNGQQTTDNGQRTTDDGTRLGVLLCINGTGILNAWMKRNVAPEGISYAAMNDLAAEAPIGCQGLSIIPFGNGAERILQNTDLGASIHGINFNTHSKSHLLRAAQEGIAYSFVYGMDIMRQMGINLSTIKAGHANLFLSPLFLEALSCTSGATIELYNTDGALGAAKGAGIGAGIYKDADEAFTTLRRINVIQPDPAKADAYRQAYETWKLRLTNEQK